MPSLHGKILGLPVWVWGVAIGGGIVAAIILRHRSQGSDASGGADINDQTDIAPDGSSMSGVASGDAGSGADFGGFTGGSGGFNEAPPPAGSTGTATNSVHLDPAVLAAIRREIERDETNDKKLAAKRKRERNRPTGPPHRSPQRNPQANGGQPPRSATTHFPQ